MSDRETHLGTGIADLDAAKRYLRHKWGQGQPEPVQVRPGARFYVTLRQGRRTALLLGPFVSHMTALERVPRARRLAQEAYPNSSFGFASFGTASLLDTQPTRFGR
jgi:hypothetical protein